VHEHDPVLLGRRKVGQQLSDDLDSFPASLGQPGAVPMQPAGVLVLEIAPGVVGIGGAARIRVRCHSSRGQHLHHHGRSGARQPGHDGYDVGAVSRRRAIPTVQGGRLGVPLRRFPRRFRLAAAALLCGLPQQVRLGQV
jgi:hypothetical protein